MRDSRGGCDGVIDQDTATHDPAKPSWFLPTYDSGDHLHPRDAGRKAIGTASSLVFPKAEKVVPQRSRNADLAGRRGMARHLSRTIDGVRSVFALAATHDQYPTYTSPDSPPMRRADEAEPDRYVSMSLLLITAQTTQLACFHRDKDTLEMRSNVAGRAKPRLKWQRLWTLN